MRTYKYAISECIKYALWPHRFRIHGACAATGKPRKQRKVTAQRASVQQPVAHGVHYQPGNGFGAYFLLHVLADRFDGTGA